MQRNNSGRGAGGRGLHYGNQGNDLATLHQEVARLTAENESLHQYIGEQQQYVEDTAADNYQLYQTVETLTAEKVTFEETARKSATDQLTLLEEYNNLLKEKDFWQKKAMDSAHDRWEEEKSADLLQASYDYAAGLEIDISGFQEENQRLQQENTELWEANRGLGQENTSLHKSVTIPQSPIAFGGFGSHESSMTSRGFLPQRFSDEKMSAPISSLIHTTKARPETFEDQVFRLPSRGLTTAAHLVPLRNHLEEGEESHLYFEQFTPYIMEEIRANMEAQLKTISRKNLRPFAARFERLLRPQEIQKDWQYVSIYCNTIELPQLDHGFYNEAVFIVLEGKTDKRKHVRKDNFDGLLAIASVSRQSDEEDENKIQLSLKIPKHDYLQYRDYWEKNPDIQIHWLCGLIPASRAYQICVDMPKVSFESQFIRGKLEPWPEISTDIMQDISSSLNPSQQHVVMSMQRFTSGIYLVQGPPGTGKTTTVVEGVGELARARPSDRILLCTPTNQALRVLLDAIKAGYPSLLIALTGIGKDLSEEMADVFVHGYAQRLYRPLTVLKKALIDSKKSRELATLIVEIRQTQQTILQKIEALLSAFGQMPVHPEIVHKMHQLLENMCLPEPEAKQQTKEEVLEQLNAVISLLKENAHVLESFLIQRAQVVGSTLVSAGRDWLKKQVGHFPIVIIDEAAQALVPEALIPLRFNPSLYIHVGDPSQLSATVTSKAAQEGGYGNSLMYWLMKELQQPFHLLDTQYRMHPAISDWPSQHFYEGKLETASEIFARQSPFEHNGLLAPIFKQPSVFFNIHGEEERRGAENSASISNEKEAIAVVKVLHYLLRCGLQSHQIGIITFYSAQVERIMQHLHKVLGRHESRKIKVNTVDGFQGGERDITLLSMVRTGGNDTRDADSAKGKSVGFVSDSRRMNVAMTRARYGRFIFGSAATWNNSNSDMPNFLRHDSARIAEQRELTEIIGPLNAR